MIVIRRTQIEITFSSRLWKWHQRDFFTWHSFILYCFISPVSLVGRRGEITKHPRAQSTWHVEPTKIVQICSKKLLLAAHVFSLYLYVLMVTLY